MPVWSRLKGNSAPQDLQRRTTSRQRLATLSAMPQVGQGLPRHSQSPCPGPRNRCMPRPPPASKDARYSWSRLEFFSPMDTYRPAMAVW